MKEGRRGEADKQREARDNGLSGGDGESCAREGQQSRNGREADAKHDDKETAAEPPVDPATDGARRDEHGEERDP
jgi:hypothetical protein